MSRVWLGRPWRRFASVVFMNSEMGDHIEPAGWREWSPGKTDYLTTADYAEFNSLGPGARVGDRDPHGRRLDAAEAARFDTRRFLLGLDGWTADKE